MKIEVIGKPIGKGRPRFTRDGHVYTPKDTREYEKQIRDAYIAQGGVLFEGPVNLIICAVFDPPKSLSEKKRNELIGKPRPKKPDLDNIIKAVLDGLNGVAFHDDSQVTMVTAAKRYETDALLSIYISDDFIVEDE